MGAVLGFLELDKTGVSEIRGAFGGSWVGIALGAILFAQPLIYLALGLGFAVMVIGRLISFITDKSLNGQTVAATVIEATGAFFLLGLSAANHSLIFARDSQALDEPDSAFCSCCDAKKRVLGDGRFRGGARLRIWTINASFRCI